MADLDRVRFIDSAGLAALVGAANRAAAHRGSLHVVCARPRIHQLFRLTGLDRRKPRPAPWMRPWTPRWRPGDTPLKPGPGPARMARSSVHAPTGKEPEQFHTRWIGTAPRPWQGEGRLPGSRRDRLAHEFQI